MCSLNDVVTTPALTASEFVIVVVAIIVFYLETTTVFVRSKDNEPDEATGTVGAGG